MTPMQVLRLVADSGLLQGPTELHGRVEDAVYAALRDSKGPSAEKVGDLVRDAFYEACEAMQTWNGVLGPMSQDEMFVAWMESKARAQLVAAFPELTGGVRTP